MAGRKISLGDPRREARRMEKVAEKLMRGLGGRPSRVYKIVDDAITGKDFLRNNRRRKLGVI